MFTKLNSQGHFHSKGQRSQSNHICIWNETMVSRWGPLPRKGRKEGSELCSPRRGPGAKKTWRQELKAFHCTPQQSSGSSQFPDPANFKMLNRKSHLPSDLGSFQGGLIQRPSFNSS